MKNLIKKISQLFKKLNKKSPYLNKEEILESIMVDSLLIDLNYEPEGCKNITRIVKYHGGWIDYGVLLKIGQDPYFDPESGQCMLIDIRGADVLVYDDDENVVDVDISYKELKKALGDLEQF